MKTDQPVWAEQLIEEGVGEAPGVKGSLVLSLPSREKATCRESVSPLCLESWSCYQTL